MDLSKIMGKLQETQQKMEATHKRLDEIFIEEQSNDGLLKVSISANSKIKSIDIHNDLLADATQLEDYLIMVLNKAITKAASINKKELDAVAKMDMPMIPGMEDLFK